MMLLRLNCKLYYTCAREHDDTAAASVIVILTQHLL